MGVIADYLTHRYYNNNITIANSHQPLYIPIDSSTFLTNLLKLCANYFCESYEVNMGK